MLDLHKKINETNGSFMVGFLYMLERLIEKLEPIFKELLTNQHLATHETVAALAQDVERIRLHIAEKHKDKPLYQRPIIALKLSKFYFKAQYFETRLNELAAQAKKNAIACTFEKTVRDLQKRGFLLPISKETCIEAFQATLPELKALGITCAFNIYKKDTEFELLLFSESEGLITHTTDDPLSLLQPSYISISQLQDISGWLHNHGSARSPMLNLEAIEKKLKSLMSSCPHGAYMLHAHNRNFTLSRLSPLGTVEHMIIDLQKQLGCYTIENEGAATRTQFKRRLSQMGTPIRLVS